MSDLPTGQENFLSAQVQEPAMEGLTRLVSESLARHGFDRPLDYRRLRWSRWFRCESHHSVLVVPSKPGIFAIAEEIMDFGSTNPVRTATAGSPADRTSAEVEWGGVTDPVTPGDARLNTENAPTPRRMLAVAQFFEDDDMAFVLDRMMSRPNAMSARLASGRYFARFVVVEDQTQRRSICNALNQWVVSAAEKATGIGSHFASSLELTPTTEYVAPPKDAQTTLFDDAAGASVFASITSFAGVHSFAPGAASTNIPAFADTVASRDEHDCSVAPALTKKSAPKVETSAKDDPALTSEGIAGTPAFPKQGAKSSITPGVPHLNSRVATNIHRPSPFPSGF